LGLRRRNKGKLLEKKVEDLGKDGRDGLSAKKRTCDQRSPRHPKSA